MAATQQDTTQKSSWKLRAVLLMIALILGLFQFQNQVVQALTLSANISASPSSGTAPLNDVDLIATVSGTATGPITYKFDCRGDGSWERMETTTATSFTASNLCDYPNPGTYIAKIEVEREGLAFQGATGILVSSETSLSVELSASPSSGTAPLNDVDLRATVSGTATGSITYKFDCRGDGSWEKTVTSNETSYTAANLCDYPTSGQYTAKVLVIRDNLNFQGQVLINVTQEPGLLEVDKKARNKSDGRTVFLDSINADPSEIIEFQIQLSSTGNEIKNVKAKDSIPAGLLYRGKLKINGQESSQDILEGIDIEKILPGQPVIITYRVQVARKENFKPGISKLVNTVIAFSAQTSASDGLQIFVKREGEPTLIPTGLFSIGKLALIATLTTILVISYIFLFRYYFSSQFLPRARKSKAQRDLERMIKKRRAKLSREI